MDISSLSIAELRSRLQTVDGRDLQALIEALAADHRAGVRRLAASAQARLDRAAREDRRLGALLKYESDLIGQGYWAIAGADEVGRGALAGPLVAAAVVLKPGVKIPGIKDSKKLTARQRGRLAASIKSVALSWAVAEARNDEIDKLGLQSANMAVLGRAIEGLQLRPDFIICDGFKIRCGAIPSMGLVKGDTLCQTVAAASILAKVHRDKLMVEFNANYPAYGFEINKGYATVEHIEAIKKTGPCPLHRRSFSPVSDYGLDQLDLLGSRRQLEAKAPIVQKNGIDEV